MSDDARAAAWQRITERAWADPRFKQSLLDDPNHVLAAHGFPVPAGVNFVVVEDEPTRAHLVLPPPPSAELSISPLDRDALADYDPGF
ncbi:MAG: NHLP leader peptide family natural product precursor [Alphaproteobacteria bacterium]|nr:NHLP leader peptide family natural product precursor [Alphaproteobacteria bacterium]